MRSGTTRTYWFFSLFTMITGVVFWPLYIGNFTLGTDANDLLLPVLSHIRASLLHGDWPYWNAFQLQGLDTTVFPAYWNPLYLLYGVVFPSPAAALNAIYLTLLFIAGWGFYKLSDLYLQHDKTVVLGGLCYPLVGLFVVSGPHLGVIAAAAFLPLLLYTNHRFGRSGEFTTLLQLFLGFFVLSTMTSTGFVLLLGLGLLIQAWMGSGDHRRPPRVLLHLFGTLAAGGLLAWKMFWERTDAFISVDSVHGQVPGFYQAIQDLTSFFLPQVTAMPVEFAGLEGPAQFHHYVGIILLVFAGANIIIRPIGRDRKIGIGSLALLVLAIIGSVLESTGPLFSGMTGPACSTMLKIAFTLSILMLGLRGFEKIIKGPSKVRYAFLGVSILGAGLALSIENSTGNSYSGGLTSWFLQLDGWKTAIFSVLTAIALWIHQSTIRWGMVAALILIDLGLTNYLSQDANLWHDSPTSTFAASVIEPEKNHPEIDLNASVGRYRDQDFDIGGLDRNTGTLTRQIVRDGYWPWVPDTSRFSGAERRVEQLRYPLLYFSRDTTGMALPTIADFDPKIHVHKFTGHRWEISIEHQYEKYVVLNQNYHRGWTAKFDGERIPVAPTLTGMMMIPVKPGTHAIHFEFRPHGVQHVFGFTLILGMLAILYLMVKRRFPMAVLGCGIPFLLVFIFQMRKPEPPEIPRQPPPTEKVEYAMTYEALPQNWFLRGQQLTTAQSRSGYRSELLSKGAHYSATLQLDTSDLRDRDELRYRFFIRTEEAVNLGVVLKTSDGNTESHNIDYIRSLDSEDWTVVEGRFSLKDLPQPLITAEWYIWNHKMEDFLIDDIEIKLIP